MPVALTEYSMTAGILIAFVGLVIGCIYDRRRIARAVKGAGLKRKHLVLALAIVAAFALIELCVVKPTQLLFFDDAIYQGMAQQLIHTGQAAMCDYGTPSTCFIGEVFHEPIGLSFNLAIAFLVFGAHRSVAYGTELFLAAVAVLMTFFVALLIFRNTKAALFSELLIALSPALLVGALPTNSDVAMLAYSLVAIFFMLIFMRDRHLWSFSNMLMALALLSYMKVDALLYVPVFAAVYVLLGRRGALHTIKDTLGLAAKHVLDTDVLVALLVFVIAVAPSVTYAAYEFGYGDYGATGQIQNTCSGNFTSVQVTGNTNLQNLGANACANINFWFDAYSSQYVMQPALFTLLALLGVALLIVTGRRRELAAISVWFLAFFLLYTAFYAGSVIYGVDWRFMLSVVAQASMLGGFAVACVLDAVGHSKKRRHSMLMSYAAIAVAVAVLLCPICALYPLLSVNPSQIQQAGDARFYENFVFNDSQKIPASCLVYTYDPSLFTLNGRAAIQLSYVYNTSQYEQLSSEYGCTVLDYGYWCHTPNNLCTSVNQSFTLTPIATAKYPLFNYGYGFYYLHSKN
jgi:hypothetical protein